MLQIAVHRDDDITARRFQAREQSRLVTKVPRQGDRSDSRVAAAESKHALPGRVPRSIIHKHEFKVQPKPLGRKAYRLKKYIDITLLIIGGDNNAKQGAGCA